MAIFIERFIKRLIERFTNEGFTDKSWCTTLPQDREMRKARSDNRSLFSFDRSYEVRIIRLHKTKNAAVYLPKNARSRTVTMALPTRPEQAAIGTVFPA
jgi:hypothetical protein